jgi:pyochelin biosynthetic protein PchC
VNRPTDDPWIRRFHPRDDAPVRLLCLSHAGGAASFWAPLSAELHPEVEVLAVQYPGRHERRREPALTDVHELAALIVQALSGWIDERPLALFGHSYGAIVGYEVARLLEAGSRPPLALIASGRPSPTAAHHGELLYRAPRQRLVEQLRQFPGGDSPLLDDPDVVEMFLPALRADYQAVETYRHRPGPALGIPITAVVGDADPRVSPQQAAAWGEHTSAGFTLRVLPGGHFYLTSRWTELAAFLADRLRSGEQVRPEPRG